MPYVPEMVKNEIRDQVKEEVIAQAKAERWAEPNAMPEWVHRIGFEGDIRLRFQGMGSEAAIPPTVIYNTITGSNVNNTVNDETWWRIRARLGPVANLSSESKARVTFATGNAQNPISLNQNHGQLFQRVFGAGRQRVRALRAEGVDVRHARAMSKPFFSSEMLWWDEPVMDGLAVTAPPKHA